MAARFELNDSVFRDLLRTKTKALTRAGLALEASLKQEVTVDTWQHAQSIKTEVISPDVVHVWSTLPQAFIEEDGRKPGKWVPPLDALVWWSWRKWFHSGNLTSKFKDLDSRSRFIVWRLGKSIDRKGIKKKETYSKTFNREYKRLMDIFIKEMRKAKWITT